MSDTRGRRLILIGLVAFGVYFTSLNHQLVWDDPDLIAFVQGQVRENGLPGLLRAEFRAGIVTGYYRPVSLFSLWVDAQIGRNIPQIHHLTNVLLHVMNSILAFFIFEALLRSRGPALFGALVYAVHSVQSEAVAWVSARCDLLAALFTLLTVVIWLKSRQEGVLHPRSLKVAGFMTFLLALLSKENALMLPLALLVWDYLFQERGRRNFRDWAGRNGFWLAVWGAALAVVVLLRTGMVQAGLFIALDRYSLQGLANALRDPMVFLKVWATYFGILVVPWPQNAYYFLPHLPWRWTFIGGAALFLAVVFSSMIKAAPRRGLLGLSWLVIFLLPVGLVMPTGTPVAERYLYLPAVGFALTVGMVGERFHRRFGSPGLSFAIASAIVALLAGGTIARERIWANDLTLFTDMVRTSPAAADPHYNLGCEYRNRGRREEAAAEFETAIQLAPGYASAYLNLAATYYGLGRVADAVRTSSALVKTQPDNALARTSLGGLYLNSCRYSEALEELRRAVAIDPGSVPAHYNLGLTYSRLGRWVEAAASLNTALRYDPLFARAYVELGNVSVELGNVEAAAAAYEKLRQFDPEQAQFLRDLMQRRKMVVAD